MPLTKTKILYIVVMLLSGCVDMSEIQTLQLQINSIETDMYPISSLAAAAKESSLADRALAEQYEQKLQERKKKLIRKK